MKKNKRPEREDNVIVEVVCVDGDFWCYFERISNKKVEVPG
jgi:hypothetical protein